MFESVFFMVGLLSFMRLVSVLSLEMFLSVLTSERLLSVLRMARSFTLSEIAECLIRTLSYPPFFSWLPGTRCQGPRSQGTRCQGPPPGANDQPPSSPGAEDQPEPCAIIVTKSSDPKNILDLSGGPSIAQSYIGGRYTYTRDRRLSTWLT